MLTATDTSTGTLRVVFARGSVGPAVAEIRHRLARLDLCTAPDGIRGLDDAVFDDDIDVAVRRFQQERGITVDGIVGSQTFRRLEEARWRLGDRVLSYTAGHLAAGDDVTFLQRRLETMGFDCGRVDGVFGPLTDSGLREFQRNVGLEPDGTCGPETFRALDRLVRTVGGGAPGTLRESAALSGVRTGVQDKVVVLDPGHGGGDPGSLVGTLAEARVAEQITARIEGRLAAIGTQVLLTRGPGSDLRGHLDETSRAQFCNDTGADLVVSIHLDASASPRAHGAATFYYGDTTGPYSVAGQCAAELVQHEIVARTDLLDCRVHAKTWDLLRLTRMPAVRVECGYLSHPGDAVRLTDDAFIDALAEGIAAAVVNFFAPQ